MTDPTYADDATSLVEVTARMEAQGFTGQFAAIEGGEVRCFTCRKSSPAASVSMAALRRLEGASDPDEMAAVAAVTCPQCGTSGTLVLKYGPEATPEESDVLRDLEDRRSSPTGGVTP